VSWSSFEEEWRCNEEGKKSSLGKDLGFSEFKITTKVEKVMDGTTRKQTFARSVGRPGGLTRKKTH